MCGKDLGEELGKTPMPKLLVKPLKLDSLKLDSIEKEPYTYEIWLHNHLCSRRCSLAEFL